MNYDKSVFWFGVLVLIIALEMFIIANTYPSFMLSAIFTLVSAFVFIYLGRYHLKQIIYHFRFHG